MKKVVFLLEERSMGILLNALLPRIFPELNFQCVPHDGRSDLEKSIPRKLRAWREPGVQFVILRDNDGADCFSVKQRLQQLCSDAGRSDTLVRIVCQELEAWYLGEPDAMAEAFGNEELRGIGQKARFRDPDSVQHPSREIERLVLMFQKVSGARSMAQFLSRERNKSPSFQSLLSGIDKIVAQ